MDTLEERYFLGLSVSDKVIFVLKSKEAFGGPQSAKILNKTLKMRRKNIDSILSRLCQKGRIVRVSLGVYAYPGDGRIQEV